MRCPGHLTQQIVVWVPVKGRLRPLGPKPDRALMHAICNFTERRAQRYCICQLWEHICSKHIQYDSIIP